MACWYAVSCIIPSVCTLVASVESSVVGFEVDLLAPEHQVLILKHMV